MRQKIGKSTTEKNKYLKILQRNKNKPIWTEF